MAFLPIHEQCTRLIGTLSPFEQNSRTHSEDQIEQVCKSMRKFGFTNPVLIDENNTIIAGHCRVTSAKIVGIDEIPCVILKGLSDVDKAAYVIADNKLALNAGWDLNILQNQFEFLKEHDFNLELTGFSLEELCDLLPHEDPEIFCDEDDCPDVPEEPIAKLGDVWVLGEHRLMCGDSTSIDDVDKLMDGVKADMIYTDPPYGIGIQRSGSDKTRAWAELKTKMKNDDSNQTAIDAYSLSVSLEIPIQIFWGANYYASVLPNKAGWIVWNKNTTGQFSDCELAWTNIDMPVRMFSHTWNGFQKASEKGQDRVHPTQKPIALAEWCFNEYAPKSKTILDLFGGSGSTLIACEKTKRKCFMMELDPRYCDVIVARWEKYTGNKAVLNGA